MAYVDPPMTAPSNPSPDPVRRCKRKRKIDDAPCGDASESAIAAPGADFRCPLELHVEDTNGMWFVMPRNLSDRLLESWRSGENLKVLYLGDWEGARACYAIDFATMRQRNCNTKCEYRIKIVEVQWEKREFDLPSAATE